MQNEKGELLALLTERAVRWGDFVLSSGKRSDFYVDGKQITLHPRGAYLVAKLVLRMIQGSGVEAVGGLTIGADPMAGAVAAVSSLEGNPVPGFIVRKAKKEHGLQKSVEGVLQSGKRVAILDDVVTTGGATLEAIRCVEAMGCEVRKVICLVDREEGGGAALAQYDFAPIFRKSELVLG